MDFGIFTMVPQCVLVHPRHCVPHGTCNMGGHGCKMGQGGKRGQMAEGGEFFAAVLIY